MDLMDTLHALTAEKLSDIIQNGLPVFNKETGEEVAREPAPASYIAAAIKFLKDNDITADPGAGRFDPLKDALEGLPTLDDGDDEFGHPYN
jgi:hypothetical protein